MESPVTKLTRDQIASIPLISKITSTKRSTLYLGGDLNNQILIENSKENIPKNKFVIGEYSEDRGENVIIYRNGDYIIPILNKQELSGLVDPYLILFLNPDIMNSNEIKSFRGNPYPTLLVYGYFNLISENIKYFQAGELGIRETLNTNFYNIYKNDEIDKIPPELINTLIYRGIIIFKNSSNEIVKIHPNISSKFDLSDMLFKTLFIENYSDYVLEKDDIQSIMEVKSVASRSNEDGIFIPSYAKDYLEYVNMNLESMFTITKGPYTKIEQMPDYTILTWLGVYFLYQNRQDLLKKTNIYFGIEPGNLVFKKNEDICVGRKDKYEIISMSEIKDKIKENNPKYDLLLIEILGLLTIYSIEKDEISKLLLKLIRRRSKTFSNAWDLVTVLPNVMNIRKEYNFDTSEDKDFTSFEMNYSLKDINMYLGGNILENMIRKIITSEFSLRNEDPTIIREYINENVHFDITLPYHADINKVKQRLFNLENTIEFKEKLKDPKGLPIITHMTFGLIYPYEKSKKFVNNFMQTSLNKLIGENNYKLTSKLLGNNKVEFTITLKVFVNKKELKSRIRELTTKKEYKESFNKIK